MPGMGRAARFHDFHPLPAVPALRIAALHKSYGEHEVLRGVDLDVMRGEVVAVVGESGAGKSTLLRCLTGLERFQSGSLTLHGRPTFHEAALRRQVGLIFQGLNLQPQLSAGRNLMLAPALLGKGSAADDARAAGPRRPG